MHLGTTSNGCPLCDLGKRCDVRAEIFGERTAPLPLSPSISYSPPLLLSPYWWPTRAACTNSRLNIVLLEQRHRVSTTTPEETLGSVLQLYSAG